MGQAKRLGRPRFWRARYHWAKRIDLRSEGGNMLYLIRHGEAAAGWGNHPDPGLSDLGRRQADAVAHELEAFGIQHIISSPMKRCRQTARPLEERLDIDAEVVNEVSEILTPPGIEDRVAWLRDFMGGTWDSEAKSHVEWRDAIVRKLLIIPDNTAVFSHFVAINAVVSKLQNRPEARVFSPTYCSVTVLKRVGDQLEVQRLGSESETRVL